MHRQHVGESGSRKVQKPQIHTYLKKVLQETLSLIPSSSVTPSPLPPLRQCDVTADQYRYNISRLAEPSRASQWRIGGNRCARCSCHVPTAEVTLSAAAGGPPSQQRGSPSLRATRGRRRRPRATRSCPKRSARASAQTCGVRGGDETAESSHGPGVIPGVMRGSRRRASRRYMNRPHPLYSAAAPSVLYIFKSACVVCRYSMLPCASGTCADPHRKTP